MNSHPSLQEIFRKGRELATHDGKLWNELTGTERNNYYGLAEKNLYRDAIERAQSRKWPIISLTRPKT